MSRLGMAGSIAQTFIDSKLTPLFIIASIVLGLGAVIMTPKEEEPQIKVPMVDIVVAVPGAEVGEIEERVASPVEKLMWEIPGVEYVYSTSAPGMAMIIVRFYVGEDSELSLVKINEKLADVRQVLPADAMPPLVQLKGIDDVPILALTLWSDRYTAYDLGRMAEQLDDEIRKISDVATTEITGGLNRQIRVELDPVRLAAHGLSIETLFPSLSGSNRVVPAGKMVHGGKEFIVEVGTFFTSIDEIRSLIVGMSGGKPVRLGDVAEVKDLPEEPEDMVVFLLGPKAHDKDIEGQQGTQYPAVTISVAKRKGANATIIAEDVLEHIDEVKPYLLPSDVNLTVTRNYGETAKEKTNELIKHLLIATFSVILLIAIALGRREAVVVGVAVPVTLAMFRASLNVRDRETSAWADPRATLSPIMAVKHNDASILPIAYPI
ncbi:efflux RND transporter permease subunit [Acidobacteriota bacterium]